jgi:hypothetical protein
MTKKDVIMSLLQEGMHLDWINYWVSRGHTKVTVTDPATGERDTADVYVDLLKSGNMKLRFKNCGLFENDYGYDRMLDTLTWGYKYNMGKVYPEMVEIRNLSNKKTSNRYLAVEFEGCPWD